MNTRLRQIASMIALLSVVLSAQGGLLARVVFEMRQDHIAAHHCENRFDPASRCNGVCFLKKHMDEHQQHGQEQNASIASSLVLYFLASHAAQLLAPSAASATIPERPEAYVPRPWSGSVYHPPRSV